MKVGEEPLGVECSSAARARGRYRLAVGVVDEVTRGEDARDVGCRGAALDQHVALRIQVDDTLDQLVAWVVADSDEHTGDGQLSCLAGDRVPQGHPGDLVLPVDGVHGRVPGEGDLVVVHRALDHDLGCAQRVAPVHDRHGSSEPGQEGGLLDGGVATTDDHDVLVTEEAVSYTHLRAHETDSYLVC